MLTELLVRVRGGPGGVRSRGGWAWHLDFVSRRELGRGGSRRDVGDRQAAREEEVEGKMPCWYAEPPGLVRCGEDEVCLTRVSRLQDEVDAVALGSAGVRDDAGDPRVDAVARVELDAASDLDGQQWLVAHLVDGNVCADCVDGYSDMGGLGGGVVAEPGGQGFLCGGRRGHSVGTGYASKAKRFVFVGRGAGGGPGRAGKRSRAEELLMDAQRLRRGREIAREALATSVCGLCVGK